MAAELASSDRGHVAALFDAVPQDQTFIRAALRAPTTRTLVDDPGRSSVALLLPAKGGVGFLAGEPQPSHEALRELVRLALDSGATNTAGLRLAMPLLTWTAVLERAFGCAFAPRERRSYRFVDQNGLDRCRIVPTGYAVHAMDDSLARRVMDDADPELADAWPDAKEFAQRSIGFCTVEESTGRATSAAWSAFEPDGLVEIGVGTAADHRGRGLAGAVAARLVAECLRRGLEPRWSTDFDNLASRRVAAKVGFGNVTEHDWPLYTPFNAGRRAIALPPDVTRAYHGRYTASGKTITIDHDGRALRFYDQLRQTLTLAAESETRFFLREVPIELEFTRDAAGRVDGFERRQGGKEYRMVRVEEDV